MIISCFVSHPTIVENIFDKLLRDAGYVKISEKAYVHQGGEQLTAAISFSRRYLPELDTVKECLTLFLSDAEHAINYELCNNLNEYLVTEAASF